MGEKLDGEMKKKRSGFLSRDYRRPSFPGRKKKILDCTKHVVCWPNGRALASLSSISARADGVGPERAYWIR